MQVITGKANGLCGAQADWNAINWRKVFAMLKNLRSRIFRAAKESNYKKLRSLQKLMLRSYSNVVASIRKVTQLNHGKTTAGIDGRVANTKRERANLTAELLSRQPWTAKPARRVYIPKAGSKTHLRPLGIPVVADRCSQCMVVNALEPEWEARFEATSYGFRPGRGCHDAIERIYNCSLPGVTRAWVLDADIKGAFDNICHEHIMNSIGKFPARTLVKQWLKAGYVEKGIFHPTEKGTPQGGSCSPLLANIALHGMEDAVDMRYAENGRKIIGERLIVRYADDFVVFCKSKADAYQMIPILNDWLGKRGLQLSVEKTRVVHLTEGFDFLGFNVRQYAKSTTRRGYKLLIKPSAKAQLRLRTNLKQEWLRMRTTNITNLVIFLNPKIRGWANYYRTVVSKSVFRKLDEWLRERQFRYIKRMHNCKSHQWRCQKYWGQLNLDRKDKWVFGDKKTGFYMVKFSWTPIQRHVQVKGCASPDDRSLVQYWKRREKQKSAELVPRRQEVARRQQYRCIVCNTSLFNDEELHLHHVKPKKLGGDDRYRNLRLIHSLCHKQLHANMN